MTALVQIRVEVKHLPDERALTILRVGGIEFRRRAADEAEAARIAMEVQGVFETKLGVEFDDRVSP